MMTLVGGDSLSYPVIIILDSDMISGNAQSSVTSRLTFPITSAEVLYIKLPLRGVDSLLRLNGSVMRCERQQFNKDICYNILVKYSGQGSSSIPEFIFTKKFEHIEVKPETTTQQQRDQLVRSGKLKAIVIEEYLENLRNGIRYWNGHDWQKEWTKV